MIKYWNIVTLGNIKILKKHTRNNKYYFEIFLLILTSLTIDFNII